jgi:hypothetical protein
MKFNKYKNNRIRINYNRLREGLLDFEMRITVNCYHYYAFIYL